MILILTPNIRPESEVYRQLMAHLSRLPNIRSRVHQEQGAQQTLTEIYLIGNTLAIPVEEMKAFDQQLEQVSLVGFGLEALRLGLRQYAINDAVLSLTACWLRRLERQVRSGESGRLTPNPHPQPLSHPMGEGSVGLSPTEAVCQSGPRIMTMQSFKPKMWQPIASQMPPTLKAIPKAASRYSRPTEGGTAF